VPARLGSLRPGVGPPQGGAERRPGRLQQGRRRLQGRGRAPPRRLQADVRRADASVKQQVAAVEKELLAVKSAIESQYGANYAQAHGVVARWSRRELSAADAGGALLKGGGAGAARPAPAPRAPHGTRPNEADRAAPPG